MLFEWQQQAEFADGPPPPLSPGVSLRAKRSNLFAGAISLRAVWRIEAAVAIRRLGRRKSAAWGWNLAPGQGRCFLYSAGMLMKTFWQHASGEVYAVESDSFGHVVGAAGPLALDKLRDLSEYNYHCGFVAWIERAIARRQLHRINPAPAR